jgi:hypothetical protein
MGLPAHALMVHAAVVLVPLLALCGATFAVLPRWRSRIGWTTAGLAVAAPVAAFLAKESGEELEEVLVAKRYPAGILNQVLLHSAYGSQLFWWTVGLALVTGALLFVTKRPDRLPALPSWTTTALVVLVVLVGAVTLYVTYLTGDTGARAVWGGVL